MKTVITGTVSAFLLLPIIGAGAQAQPVPEVHSGNVTPGELARFKVEAVAFDALAQTESFADEVYVQIHVPALKVATNTVVFKGVEDGENRSIPFDQSCIAPIAGVNGPTTLLAYKGHRWSCSLDGVPGPISFTVVLREKDTCRRWLGCFTHGVGEGWEGTELGPMEGFDDLIGRHTVEYSMEKLMTLQVGESEVKSSLVSGGDGIYDFAWRLTRLPDAEPVVGPVTRLQKSGPRE